LTIPPITASATALIDGRDTFMVVVVECELSLTLQQEHKQDEQEVDANDSLGRSWMSSWNFLGYIYVRMRLRLSISRPIPGKASYSALNTTRRPP
jgi:hypothetical protein